MKKIIKPLLISIAILIGGAAIGYLLLAFTFSYEFPWEKREALQNIIHAEGYHFRDYLHTGTNDYYHDNFPDIVENGTDEVIINFATSNPSVSAFKHANFPEYARYWHGYAVFWRPLFKVFELPELRVFNLILQSALALLLAFLLYSATGKKRFSLAWLSVYLIMLPNTMAISLQYSSSYYVGVICAIGAVALRKFPQKGNRYLYLFLVAGMLTAYFDFLTYPLFTWGLPALTVLALYSGEGEEKDFKYYLPPVLKVVFSAVVWSAGYVIFWAEKWAIASFITGANGFKDALDEFALRAGTEEMTMLDRLGSFNKNWHHFSFLPFLVVYAIWIGWWMYAYFRRGLRKDPRIFALVLIVFSSFVWFTFAAQHTFSHTHFTWRNGAVTMLAGLFIVAVGTEKKPVESGRSLGKIAVFGICAALTLVICIFLPVDTYTSTNFDSASEEIVLPAGEKEAFSLNLTPLYGFVKEIDPFLECEDASGSYEFILKDGGEIVHTAVVPVSEASGNRIFEKVYWHLKKGHTYELVISTENVSAPVTLWTTLDQNPAEFAGNERSLTIGIVYYCTCFANKTDALFYLMSWFSLFMMIVYCLYGKIFGKKLRK